MKFEVKAKYKEGRNNPWFVYADIAENGVVKQVSTRVSAKDEKTAIAIGSEIFLKQIARRGKGEGGMSIRKKGEPDA